MFEVLLVAWGLVWPAECVSIGNLYRDAAALRDQGYTLNQVMKMTTDARVQRLMVHVYQRPDMTPNDWKWFATGACIGEERRVKT